ncbi:hypothetical protein BG015_003824 [Linnemannia schmuckeri]|uniref:Antifreeze protein n=1 Tax=Linnemannia schmuckeri TaxID=64567 RepID=A0A9P5S5M6_9FUNG|nr:hypothetical protein BG015_003824 [Linnemannia schmuckeri]
MKLQLYICIAATVITIFLGRADATCGTIQKMLAMYGCGPVAGAPAVTITKTVNSCPTPLDGPSRRKH